MKNTILSNIFNIKCNHFYWWESNQIFKIHVYNIRLFFVENRIYLYHRKQKLEIMNTLLSKFDFIQIIIIFYS